MTFGPNDVAKLPTKPAGWKHTADGRRHIAAALRARPPAMRVMDKVLIGEGCWTFTGSLTQGGYGAVGCGSRLDGTKRLIGPHRVMYEALVGPIPAGMTLDHLCHTRALERGECAGGPSCVHRACCNPDHLEPVSFAENVRRGASPSATVARQRRGEVAA